MKVGKDKACREFLKGNFTPYVNQIPKIVECTANGGDLFYGMAGFNDLTAE